jgi:mannose-6-phosphate isomerase
MPTAACYPLSFRPMLYPKVWGGRALARLAKPLPDFPPHLADAIPTPAEFPAGFIGESWELADLASTSASGAGGSAARSVIAAGPLAGRAVSDAMAEWGADLLGSAKTAAGGGFPLLIKFLDAREHLSVQVHPSPAYAKAHPEAKLKTECWYILHAEPGAVIYKGIRPGCTPEQFARAIAEGTVEQAMIAVPAIAGECHNLPSGTCHALGAGVLVAEVQTPSDTTFRVFDWGRSGRELHVAQALECIDFGPAPAAAFLPGDLDSARLVSTEFFTLDEVRCSTGEPVELGRGAKACEVVIVTRGGGTLRSSDGQFAPVRCNLGSTTLVPFRVLAGCVFNPESETTLLRAVPR